MYYNCFRCKCDKYYNKKIPQCFYEDISIIKCALYNCRYCRDTKEIWGSESDPLFGGASVPIKIICSNCKNNNREEK